MPRASRSISDILNPALSAIALSVFIAGCTSTAVSDEQIEGTTEAMMEESSAMMDDTKGMMDDSRGMMTSSAPAMMGSEGMMASSMGMMMDDSAYNDGTYSADGVYRSPAGAEEIHVTMTLKDDVITSAQVEGTATHPKSKAMQEAFIAGFGAQVVGKSIDELSLGVVNGSSLTPKGFMDAVAKIKVEAAS